MSLNNTTCVVILSSALSLERAVRRRMHHEMAILNVYHFMYKLIALQPSIERYKGSEEGEHRVRCGERDVIVDIGSPICYARAKDNPGSP